ncbi:MAG: SUMF1/EgtB/PvdO family nonheme iron enzyme [Candidatus Cloacimonetes bacterium]|nr:SUMF1/EgtB/PvdO family nonheme iron enzyme [Candidatus Cloacimonadota bacterium]
MGWKSASGSNRVKRGGSWNNNANNCTVSNRNNNNNATNTNNNIGFRCLSIFIMRTCPGFTAGHTGKSRFPSCSRTRDKKRKRTRSPVA